MEKQEFVLFVLPYLVQGTGETAQRHWSTTGRKCHFVGNMSDEDGRDLLNSWILPLVF